MRGSPQRLDALDEGFAKSNFTVEPSPRPRAWQATRLESCEACAQVHGLGRSAGVTASRILRSLTGAVAKSIFHCCSLRKETFASVLFFLWLVELGGTLGREDDRLAQVVEDDVVFSLQPHSELPSAGMLRGGHESAT